MDLSNTTLGFVGCGKIGSAVARGFARCNPPPKSIVVSPRSRDKAEALKAEFPSIVTIAESNDEVVSAADVVFYGLLPGVAREVLPTMPFRKEQLIISMMAAIDYAETLTFSGDVVPMENIVRTVPLPSAAKRSGPILMHPPNARADAVLSCVGTVVACAAEAEMKPMICLTAHISSFFELERVNQQFMEDNGVQKDAAKKFTASFYESLATSAAASHEGFADLRDEAATPGGLNQQSTDALKAGPHYTAQVASMQVILDRLNGK
jgi:pyrroline-5-carboxylate reductase